MIHFLSTRRHDYTMRGFLDGPGAAIAGRVRLVAYDDVLDHDPDRLPDGAWIFSDVDRLTADRSAAAARLWRRLADRGCRMLNHPTRSLRRFALLRRLREAGINDFDVRHVTDFRAPGRYPAFLRRTDGHQGPASQLLHDQAALVRALKTGFGLGWLLESFIVVEFQETRSADGFYRKYSVVKIGDRVFPMHLFRAAGWINKEAPDAIWSPEAIAEERDYFARHPHRAMAEAAFRLAGIEYGRMDFGIADGRIQVWEINTNPDINGSSTHFPFRAPVAAMASRNIVEGLRALDRRRHDANDSRLIGGGAHSPLPGARGHSAGAPLPLTTRFPMADDAPLPLAALWEARFGEPPPPGVDAAVPAGLARILGHRTIRRYTDQAVPDGLLSVLLACAQSAPSKSDLQQSSILVVKDPAIRAEIAGWLPDQPWVGQAPVFLVFLADLRRAQRLGELRGKANDNDNLDAFLNASVDAGLALQSFILAAEAAGLGCCPISMIRDHIEKATPLLGLPPRVFPIAGLCVGWPAVAGHVSMRLPPSVAVHVDRYDDTALPGLVDAYDQRREARAPTAPDKQKMTARYGVAPFYGWSENAARQLSAPERAGFKAFLQRHGFGLA